MANLSIFSNLIQSMDFAQICEFIDDTRARIKELRTGTQLYFSPYAVEEDMDTLTAQLTLALLRKRYLIAKARESQYFARLAQRANRPVLKDVAQIQRTKQVKRTKISGFGWDKVYYCRTATFPEEEKDRWVNTYAVLDDDLEELYEECFFDFDDGTIAPLVKDRQRKFTQAKSQEGQYTPIIEAPRNPTLALRIKQLIAHMKLLRIKGSNWLKRVCCRYPVTQRSNVVYRHCESEVIPLVETTEWQMGDLKNSSATGPDESKKEEAGNVVLTESTQDVPTAVTPSTGSSDWIEMVSSDVLAKPESFTNRWLKIKQFVWTKAMAEGAEVCHVELPRDIVLNKDWADCDLNVAIPFKVNRYVHMDAIEVKVQINSNRFQLGQLQASWFYEPIFDREFARCRRNIYTASQTIHELISAGTSNEITLRIPYKAHTPMIATKDRLDKIRSLHMGVLFLRVINPLTIPTGAPDKVYGTVFVRLINTTFTGQISGALHVPSNDPLQFQMDRILQAAEAALHTYNCPNMDNPPMPFNPNYLVPTASHSWSTGTGDRQSLHALRLDVRGQTAYPTGMEDEMLISHVIQRFGLVNILEWKTVSEGILARYEAAPMMELSRYHKISAATKPNEYHLDMYALPPIAVISSFNKYYRGPIKFRFDIVATAFHTGRLIVAYVPGLHATEEVAVKHLLAGPHIILDIRESSSYTYEVPFIYDLPFAQRNYQGNFKEDAARPPSMVYIGVINSLTCVDNVSNSVFINVYVAAGEGFEMAVPVQPSIGLGFNDEVSYTSASVVQALSGYSPYYCGSYYGFKASKKLCMRYGTTSGQVAYFDVRYLKLNKMPVSGFTGQAYYYQIMYPEKAPTAMIGGKATKINYAIMVWDNKVKGQALLVPVKDDTSAIYLCRSYVLEKENANKLSDGHLLDADDTTNNLWCKGNPVWTPVLVEVVLPPPPNPIKDDEASSSSDSSLEIIQPQVNDTELLQAPRLLRTTKAGQSLFGESFFHLKDYLRRYQLYTGVMLDLSVTPKAGQLSFILPILPQGLHLEVGTHASPIELTNRARDGIIPLILSGYRYYRGGIRMRIVIPSKADVLVYLQHKNDRRLRSLRPITTKDITSGEDMFNHGYAYYVQDTAINSIIEVEIPYYYAGMNSFLQSPMLLTTEEGNAYSLGELCVGFNMLRNDAKSLKNVYITAFYSVADDFQASVYQGFPPMVICDKIVQIDKEKVTVRAEEAEPQGLFDYLSGKFVNNVKDEVKAEVHKAATAMEEKVNEMKGSLEAKGFGDILNSSFFRVCASQLAHVVINFSWKSLTIALVTIFVEIGCVVQDAMQKALTVVGSFVGYIKEKVTIVDESGQQQDEPELELAEEAVPQSDYSEEDASVGLVALLWTGLCSLFSVTPSKLTTRDGWSKMMTKDLTGAMRSGNVVYTFARNIFSCLDSMKLKIFGMKDPRINICDELSELFPTFQAWVDEVLYLIDTANFERLKYVQWYILRVAEAYATGAIFFSKIYTIKEQHIVRTITMMFEKISTLRDKLKDQGIDAYVAKQTFGIWISGVAGLGKTTFGKKLANKLLFDAQIKFNVPPIYVHNQSSEFWDSECGNPVMMVDDMFNVQTGILFERQLALLFAVISPVVMTPPKARLEDKGRVYNPEILLMCSNHTFLRFNNVDMDAVHRRRHVLIQVQPNLRKKDGCEHCIQGLAPEKANVADVADFHHMEFYLADNHLDPGTTYRGPFDYATITDIVSTTFLRHRERSAIMYKQEMEAISAILTDNANSEKSFQERVQEYKREQETKRIAHLQNSIYEPLKQNLKDAYQKSWDYAQSLFVKQTPPATPQMGKNDVWEAQQFHFRSAESAANYFLVTSPLQALSNIPMTQNQRKLIAYGSLAAASLRENNELDDSGHIAELLKRMNDRYRADVKLYSSVYDDDEFIEVFINEIKKGVQQSKRQYERKVYSRNEKGKKVIEKETVKAYCCECYEIFDCVKVRVNNDLKFEVYNVKSKSYVDPFACDNPHCMFESDVLKYWLCLMALSNSSMLRMYYGVNCEDKLPLWMRRSRRPDLDEDKWKQCWQRIKDVYFDVVATMTPKIKTFLRILTLIGLVLMFLAPLLGPLMLAVGVMIRSNRPASQGGWAAEPEGTYSQRHHRNMNESPPRAQAQSQCPQLQVAEQRILHNMFTITVKFGLQSVEFTGVVLKARKLMLIRHYHEEVLSILADNAQVSFFGKFSQRKDVFDNTLGLQFNYMDLKKTFYNKIDGEKRYMSNMYVVDLPLIFSECKPIVQFFATQQDHVRANGTGMLVRSDGRVVDCVNYKMDDGRPTIVGSTASSSAVAMERVYSYPMQGKGMCGSILLASNLERCIIGVHVAGITSGNIRGIAEVLNYETFNEVVEDPKTTTNFVMPELATIPDSKLVFDSALYAVGKSPHVNFQSGETSYCPSIIHGTFPIRTEPNPLKINDPRLPKGTQPLREGVNHMGKPPLDFPEAVACEASSDLQRVILDGCKPIIGSRILTLQEAVCGDPEVNELESLDWNTSSGFPLKFMKDTRSASGKKWLFDLELTPKGHVLKSMHPKLAQLLSVDEQCRKKNVRPFTVFIDCLKDTCLPIEKCKVVGKTRIFSISPVQFTIAFRRYFGSFMAAYRRSRFAVESAIGINTDSLEWTNLAAYVMGKGSAIIAGDYKNFGPSLMLQLVHKAFGIIFNWYAYHGETDEERQVRKVLSLEIINAFHLKSDIIYQCPAGIPSGSPITDILNSMVNSLYIRCAWSMATQLPMLEFTEKCRLVTYGDDLLIGVSDDIKEQFNTITIANVFSKHNIVFTDADKDSTLVKWRDINTVSFLKRHFVLHPYRHGVYMAKLDNISIEGCTNWIKKQNNKVEATIQNCEMAILMKHSYGQHEYDQIILQIRKALQEHGKSCRYYSWNELDRLRYSELTTARKPCFGLMPQLLF